MKPHLPLKLLSALLTCLGVSVFPAHAATSWEGEDYSGNIYTWVGNNGLNVSSGGISLTTSDGTSITYGAPITTWGSASTEGTVWNLFANEGGLTEYNTLRFAASGTPITGDISISDSNKAPACDFTPLTLGGLIVETGAEGFTLGPNNNNARNAILGKAGDTPLPVLFTVKEDFSLGTAANTWNTVTVNGDWNVLVSTGKTLNIFGALNAAAGRTMTVGGENAGGTLVLNKAANANMQAAWDISHGATVQLKNAAALGTGAVSLNGGNLSVDAGANASITNAVTIAGASGITVANDAQFSNIKLTGGTLTMSGGALNIASTGHFSVAPASTLTGNLNLGTGVFIDVTHITANGDALLSLNGTVTVNGSLFLENSDGFTWTAGTYNLINATDGITGDLLNTIALGTDFIGNWDTTNNVLKFVVQQMTSLTWTGGGDNTWTVGGAGNSPWNAGSTFENGSGVIFGDVTGSVPQTVTLAGQVNPGLILINAEATNYTWTGTGSLTGSSKLQKSGSGSLVIATDNSGFSGEMLLGGGTVEMRHAHALGTGSIVFDGSMLKYGTGITTDISGQLRTDALASNAILVDTNGNAVTWASLPGWTGAITRRGDGSLTLGAGTYGGILTNEGNGSLALAVGDGQTSTLNGGISGIVTKTGTGTLEMSQAAFNASGSSTLMVQGGNVNINGVCTSNLNITLGNGTAMTVFTPGGSISGTGTLTMGSESSLNLRNGSVWGDGKFSMKIVLDAAGSHATIAGAINGNLTKIYSTISGQGGLRIQSSQGENAWAFNTGWVNNSYTGDTQITGQGNALKLTYNTDSAVIAADQVLTPWGQGNVTIGGTNQAATVTFSGITGTAASLGVALDGDITLNGANAATTLNIFTGAAGTMTLNGKVTVETSGDNGTATLGGGASLKLGGGLAGAGTLAVTTQNGTGTLTLGGDVSGFTGTLNLTGSNLYLNADTALDGTINAATAKVTAVKQQTVTGTLTAGSLAADGAALSGTGAALTIGTLILGEGATVGVEINDNLTVDAGGSTYTLASWTNLTGDFAAAAGDLTMTGTLAGLYQGTYNVDSANNQVTVTVSMADGVIVWDGNAIGAVPDTVTYLFNGAHTGEARLEGALAASVIYFNNGAGPDLVLVNDGGELSGTGAITKLGEGKVTFSSANNNYSGAVNIKEGTVVLGASKALGTGTITVDKEGRLEISAAGGIGAMMGDGGGALTVNGGTLSVNSGASNALGFDVQGGGINLEVLGEGTELVINKKQTRTGTTYVGEGATLSIVSDAGGTTTALTGTLTVNGGSLSTFGDSFGYSGTTLTSLLLENGATWTIGGGGHNTLKNLNLTLDASSVLVNTSGNGFYLFNGSHRISTLTNASGMSVIGASGDYSTQKIKVKSATTFNIARGNFGLDDPNAVDLKIDIAIVSDGTPSITKEGNGILELTRANTYTGQTLIREGTILLTGAGTLGSGAVTLGGNGEAFLTYGVDGEQTVANAIGGTGTITQKGTGTVTLSGANTYTGTTSVEGGTLAAGNAAAFGTSRVSIFSGATLDIGSYAINNAIHIKGGTAGALSTGALASNGGTIGSLTLESYSRLNVTGSLSMAADSSFTFDMTGLSAGDNALVTLTGGLTLTGTHDVTLNNYDTLENSGNYSLLTVGSGTLTIGSFNIGELASDLHPEFTYTLGLSADGKTLQLKIESSADMLTWNGTANTGTWTAGDVANWTYGGSGNPPTTTDGQPLLFDNTAANKTVTITGNVSPSSIVVNNSGDNTYTFQGEGSITGTETILTKRGNGTLQIRNTNTYGGSTTLEGGTVDINADGALGTGSIIFGGGTLQASGNVTLTQTMVQKNAGDSVKLAASGAGTTLTVNTDGEDSYLDLNWNISGTGAVALENIADTKVLSGTVTVADGSTLNLSGGSEIALSGVLRNISGTLAKTDGGSLLVKALNGNDALNGTLANAGGSIVLSGYGAATANRTITVNGELQADLMDVTYGVTLDLQRNMDIATLQVGGGTFGGNSQASAVNVGTGVTLTSASLGLGGANGQGALAGNLNVNGGTAVLGGVSMEDNSNSGITLSAGGTLTLGGNITGTSGTLTLGQGTLNSSAAWTASTAVVLNAASGQTTTADTTGGAITLNGALSGTGSLLKTGTGTLTLGNASADYAGTITLASGTLAFTAGAQGFNGALNITGGSVTGGENYKGVKNVAVNASSGVSTISLGGLSGSALKTISTTDAGTVISGINGAASLDSAALAVGTGNVSKTQDLAGSTSIIQFDADGAQLDIETLTLTLSADVIEEMKGWGTGERTAWLNLTNGALGYGTATFNPLLESLGFAVTDINGGSIGITGDATQIYAVGSQDKTITANTELDPYRAVIVDGNLALNLPGVDDTAEGLTINNLSGAASGLITITATDDKTASVILNNELLGADPDTSGPDTKYSGTIQGGTANITKTGAGSLELAGTLNTTGTLDMQDGNLILSGTADVGSIRLNSSNSGNLSSLDITGNTQAATLTDEGNGGNLSIGKDGTLTLTGAGSELSAGTLSGAGLLQVAGNASLALNGTSRLEGVQVELDANGTLELGNAANSISALTGSGALVNGSALEITASADSLYQGTISGEGSITINGTGTQALQGNGATGQALNVAQGTLELMGAQGGNGSVTYKSLTAGTGARVRLTTVGDGTDVVNTTLTVTNGLNLSGSTLELVVNTNRDDLFSSPVITVQAGDANLDGAILSLGSLGDYDDPADPSANLNFTLVDATGAGGTVTANGATVDASGYFDFYYQQFGIRTEGGKIVVTGMVKTDNAFMDTADTANSQAGAGLLWNSRGSAPKGTQLGDLREAIRNDIQTGNTSRAARSMAAAAGSTVNALGTAQRDALRDQMGWIRNRTTLMGVNPAYINEDLPYFHMWVEGTGSYAKLDTTTDESGYQLTTWGGTVGMDVDISDHFTMGAAFTANYGDLTASAADNAEGHLDSYYANLFGRYQSKRWAHTLILTGGWNDAKLDRTVNYGEGGYRTQGNTNGWGFGAMYELTYDIYLNEDKSSVLQPLVNASIVKTSMDGYTETGAGNAGLNVGKQEWTTGTVALGGRWMGLAGSNVFGREALVELRANVAQDLGDERGETGVGFLANPGYTQTVRGAKVGRTALQIGAGVSVPVGTQGTVFVNGNADFRDGANSVNGSIGYRYDF